MVGKVEAEKVCTTALTAHNHTERFPLVVASARSASAGSPTPCIQLLTPLINTINRGHFGGSSVEQSRPQYGFGASTAADCHSAAIHHPLLYIPLLP
ncbi:hypothetical protein E4U41_000939 [Claviceps citrina]|nr:hypothetical protein E4U41_000939 [Claviceps citrina]